MTVLSVVMYAVSALTALLGLYYLVKGLSADLVLLGASLLLALVWLIEAVVLTVADLGGAGPAPDRITLYGYFATGILLPLAATWLGATERSKWGSAGVLAVAVTQIVLQLRLPQIWPGGFA